MIYWSEIDKNKSGMCYQAFCINNCSISVSESLFFQCFHIGGG